MLMQGCFLSSMQSQSREEQYHPTEQEALLL
ncbi:hypothetical protein JOC58_002827 [Paenibacillus hunanensis]|uniref:Uncharacterized protein n=1 Tax=Paenibacillus hunanensis TaxID=539262 RepID=A0ABU1J089_9BACL|nr:hypothetical protein [Paenibacillus hunanensis]